MMECCAALPCSIAEMAIPDVLPNGVGMTEYLQTHNIVPYPLLPAVYGNLSETPLQVEVSATGPNEIEIQLQGVAPAPPSTHKGPFPSAG